jgi:hypothetical protein
MTLITKQYTAKPESFSWSTHPFNLVLFHLGGGAEIKPITFYHGSWRQEKKYSRRIPHISQLWLGALGPWQPRIHLLSRRPHGKVQVGRM